MKTSPSVLCLTLLMGAALFLPARSAMAQGVRGEVLIIHALEAEGAIDPALANIAVLRRPPFSSYRSMRVLSRPTLRLALGQAAEIPLPNGRRLRVTLQGISDDGRFQVTVSINRPNQNDYLREARIVASPGDPFFVAGQTHDGGILLIGVRLGQRSTG